MRVQFLSNDPETNSGYGVVCRHLVSGLALSGFDVSVSAINSDKYHLYNGIPVYPVLDREVSDSEAIARNAGFARADVVVSVCDSWARPVLEKLPWVCYAVVDSNIVGGFYPRHLSKSMGVVAMSDFGKSVLEGSGVGSIVVPHGVDTSVYHPDSKYDGGEVMNLAMVTETGVNIGDMDVCGLNALKDHFGVDTVILFVGKNLDTRKRMERLLEAVSMVDGDFLLHMHTLPYSRFGLNLIELVRYYGLSNKVMISYGMFEASDLSCEAMSQVYNSSDLFVTSSAGESFGLPTIESMACGVPVVAPRNSTFVEHIGDSRGLLADIASKYLVPVGGEFMLERSLVDVNSLADCIQMMVDDRKLREGMSSSCVEFASGFEWSGIVDMWVDMLSAIEVKHMEKEVLVNA